MRSNIKRGTRFVRAYYYLELIKDGHKEEKANELAQHLLSKYDTSDNKVIIHAAKIYADVFYAGKQLPVIHDAYTKGFQG